MFRTVPLAAIAVLALLSMPAAAQNGHTSLRPGEGGQTQGPTALPNNVQAAQAGGQQQGAQNGQGQAQPGNRASQPAQTAPSEVRGGQAQQSAVVGNNAQGGVGPQQMQEQVIINNIEQQLQTLKQLMQSGR